MRRATEAARYASAAMMGSRRSSRVPRARRALAVLWVSALAAAVAAASDREEGFFFVHLSDAHVYRHSSQVEEHYGLGPSWTPRVLLAFMALRGYERRLIPVYTDAIVPHMRVALGMNGDGSGRLDLWDAWTYFDEVLRRGSALGLAEDDFRAAFSEVHALRPAFVINTGDIVFDSGRVPPEVSADWMALYREVSEAGPAPVYNTIGNHELGYVEREDASPEDPRYGPGFFVSHLGRIPYGFDRGAFHFVALDTHSPGRDGEGWRFNRMRPEVRAWLEADLARHRDRVLVLLNHEPFYYDTRWAMEDGFAESDVVHAEDLLAGFEVDYTLTGHVHLPGTAREGTTTHISTGALSGQHWILPHDAAPRGYRLFYARGRELFSAWKETGRPVAGFVRPSGGGRHFPASGPVDVSRAPDGTREVVAVAADRDGPFARVTLHLDEREVPLEPWGDYFFRAALGASDRGTLRLTAERTSGEALRSEASLADSR